ncbi:MAG TPA: hypothetical protein VGN24_06675 [Rhodanobacter sp.]|nr:hypothetical protein [Rhodanobacter sp.]
MTQSASMSASWHPAIHADWLVLRRTGAAAFVRMFCVPVLLLACCAAVACGDFYRGYGWCLAAVALLALGGSYAIAHLRLLDAVERWRFGWCGALPTRRDATVSTLLLVTTAALLASLVVATALLLGVSMHAPHRADLPYALTGIDLALVVGMTVAALRALHTGARVHQADGIREPLFALPWLNDPHLPHLLDWQRRAALVRWRRGGGGMMVALALFAVPDGASVLTGSGLVLFVISLTWLDVALRACVKTTAEAARLLRPTPAGGERLRAVSLRYPLLATACATSLTAAGAILLGDGAALAGLGGVLCAIAAIAWPLSRIVAAARSARSSA